LDDFEVPIGDTPDIDLSGGTEFPEVEMVENSGEISDSSPFEEPDYTENNSEENFAQESEVDTLSDSSSINSENEPVEMQEDTEQAVDALQDDLIGQPEQSRPEEVPDEWTPDSDNNPDQIDQFNDSVINASDDSYDSSVDAPDALLTDGEIGIADNSADQATDYQGAGMDNASYQLDETVPGTAETNSEQTTSDSVIEPGMESDILHPETEVQPEELEPNKVYERNGYEYKTDEMGRTKLVSGDLQLVEGERTPLQTEIGHMGLETDEGGHLLATRFDGPTDAFNLVPQDENLNRGAWKSMENSWAEGLSKGQDVKVMVEPVYGDDTIRPESFEVLSQIDGELTYSSFLNESSKEVKGEKK
jgi:hypothetical protein